jgi:hypothetical protein
MARIALKRRDISRLTAFSGMTPRKIGANGMITERNGDQGVHWDAVTSTEKVTP